jgi:hypothetical protein
MRASCLVRIHSITLLAFRYSNYKKIVMTDKIKEATEAFANAFGILVNDFIKLAFDVSNLSEADQAFITEMNSM